MGRIKIAALSLSAAALVGIVSHEGYVETAYKDIVGIWTIGYGTTKGVKPQDRTNPVSALKKAHRDIVQFEAAIKECVNVPLYQHEYDSFLSLSYNIGSGAFCKSTLVRRLNAGDYAGACQEILRWNRAGGRVVRGLVIRREQEYKQCIGQ